MTRPRFSLRVEGLEDRLAPATFTVTTAANGGAGSLRAAIVSANTTPGADIIDFNIPGAATVQKINLRAALPAITESVTIDGTSQPGFATTPVVVLNGAATAGASGLIVAAGADNSIIRGLVIHRFDGHGIVLESDGNIVETCFIGTNPLGTAAPGNGGTGIMIQNDSANNVIGGAGGAMNLISGNGGHGVAMKGAGVTGNVVRGSFIGTNLAGDASLHNRVNGVNINRGANGNTVGDVSDLINIVTFVAGNDGQGINISGVGTSNNVVVHTTIGSNLGSGVRITNRAINNTIGSSADGEFNVISANFGNGVLITGSGTTGNTVLGNMIGTDQDGLLALGNGRNGVAINFGASGNTIGGSAPFEGNVISANVRNGVNIATAGTSGNTVAGNIIGTNVLGTAALPNGRSGVQIALGAAGNAIGGTTTDALNLISGNTQHGIVMRDGGTTGNSVIGNAIGTNLAGNAALANGRHGVVIGPGARENSIGGAGAGEGNTISGNTRVGVLIQANLTQIQGNKIGTGTDGTTDVGNGLHGVFVTSRAANTAIGGTGAGDGNIIAFNDGSGVLIGRDPAAGFPIAALHGNSVLGNSIFSNALLGIDLNGGANHNQAAPVINSAVTGAGDITINFTLTSRPNTSFRIEFFTNSGVDPEGETFLGFVNVITDATGTVTDSVTFLTAVTPGTPITATATHADRNDTSEFSAAVNAT